MFALPTAPRFFWAWAARVVASDTRACSCASVASQSLPICRLHVTPSSVRGAHGFEQFKHFSVYVCCTVAVSSRQDVRLTVVNPTDSCPAYQERVEIKPRPGRTSVVQNAHDLFSFRLNIQLIDYHILHLVPGCCHTPRVEEWLDKPANTSNDEEHSVALEGCEQTFADWICFYPGFGHRT